LSNELLLEKLYLATAAKLLGTHVGAHLVSNKNKKIQKKRKKYLN
jgi:hypothetical protein